VGAAAAETVRPPFAAFNFAVELDVPGVSTLVCNAAFAECDGLEQTLDVKTLREGGNNGAQIRLAGAVSYGTLTLKRGMTSSFDLWTWMDLVVGSPWVRGSGEVVVHSPDRTRVDARFVLTRVLPVKLKAPPLNAKDGLVAIEELQLAYDSLRLEPGEAARA
jgi:phage tail-like protein